MTYQEALKYLESFQRFGIRLGLRNIRRLLRLLGNPQERLKVIHIGGTNGKGSVGAFLFYILKEAGYKVGFYTSPHLVDFRERIRTNEGLIPKRELTKLVKKISHLISPASLREAGRAHISHPDLQPTFFEITTAIALRYFAEQGVDFVILEVGMGGRLDATNVTKPLVSVITNVDFEHTEHLGKSLRKIAYEKCGIIKEKVPVITAENKGEALRVIEDTCRERKARLYRIGKEILIKGKGLRVKGQGPIRKPSIANYRQTFNVTEIYSEYDNLKISLLGKHQLLNAACALGAIELLRPKAKITKEEIGKGLAKTIWPGRLEVIRLRTLPRGPRVPSGREANSPPQRGETSPRAGELRTVILDGAHNVAGAKVLKKAIGDCFNYRRLILLLGILRDKDIKGIVAQLAPLASRIIITRPQSPRAAEPEEIAEIAKEYSDSVVIKERVSQAIEYALSCAKRRDIVLITGSLYTVGEAKTYLEG